MKSDANAFTLLLPEAIMETDNAVLTFESVNKIVLCYRSNETTGMYEVPLVF